MPRLRLKPLYEYGRPVPLGEEPITIGRHPQNTICIKDDKASRQHCIIEPSDQVGRFRVRDLGSRNGTKVNGHRTPESLVGLGDTIKIGACEFVIETDQAGGDDEPTNGREPAWATELRAVMDALPPKNSPAEAVQIVDTAGRSSEILAAAGEGSRAIRMLLQLASKSRATDIHFEPKGETMVVRMRVDGQMVYIGDLPSRIGELGCGLIKGACQMKAAARDAMQEGHYSAKFPDRRVDYRVSFTPSVHGQKLVLRVLDHRDIPTSLHDLGLASYMVDRVKKFCEKDAGMLLACGPTGSGKTTTLYNCLREIDRETHNVITIEDPVEYRLENVTQMPIDEARGNTFGTMLRSVLRQDPDVIFVGEIRDEETARTAMQAAMTGHLVLSTVHAKDTISAVFRLLDLKVEPYLVANSMDLILAQRLARALCENCKSQIPVSPAQATRIGRHLGGRTQLYAATGCATCLRTGYRGRRAIFELLDFTDDLRDVILKEPTIQAMKHVIEAGLFTTLAQSGWRLAAEGVTTLDEVDAVTGG